MQLKNQRVLVVGLGKSGVAAARFLAGQGARVTVSDAKSDAGTADIPALLDLGIVVETGTHGETTFLDQDLIVVSPGVPLNTPQLELARKKGLAIIGEVEMAARWMKGRIAAITGSNGKTTTTTLIGEIFAKSGLPTQVGGNIGTPVTDLIAGSTESTWNVLEISSFQLETVAEAFHPHIAGILNITPDHLDRHGSMESYIAAKARILENQRSDDFAVLNADDKECLRLAADCKAKVFWFGEFQTQQGSFVRDGAVYFRHVGG